MDAMTRYLVNWPALLLPLVALGTVGLLGTPVPQILVILALLLALAAPAKGAKIAPFALFAYGAYGLFKLHSLLIYESQGVHYGLVTPSRGLIAIPGGYQLTSRTSGFELMLAEAVGFMALGVCVLAVTSAPGGRALRRAVAQLRGGDGQPKTVPPLLLFPVIFLWEELFSEHLWFAGTAAPGVLAAVIFAVGAALIVRLPQVAAVIAVAGTVILGLYGVSLGVHWLATYGDAFSGAMDSPQFGAVLLDGGRSELLAGLQGLTLLGFGGFLVPRLLTWDADAALAARAQALTRRVTRLTETRSDATDTAVAELRRIERDLHDGAQARLVAVGMSLRAAEELMRANPEAARALVAEARETSSRALDDLRGLVRGIYPPVLADRGLADAVRALALDAPISVNTDITLDEEDLPMPVAAAVYFAIAEALTNAVRHAEADTVEIGIGYSGNMLRATITDDGIGGADPSHGTGLLGVERRLATFDGIMAVTSPVGGPTIVVLEVPCALADGAAWSGDHTWADVVRSSWQTRTLI
jgi:signal transduction histidine kinase